MDSKGTTPEPSLTAMISHESMHVGQIVVFCYATDIGIPGEVVEAMALSG